MVATTLEGEINILSIKDNFNQVKHESTSGVHRTNVVYCCKTIAKDDEGIFLAGYETKSIEKFQFEPKENYLESLGKYTGHSNSIRAINVSPDNKLMLSSCEDHSLRVWDY